MITAIAIKNLRGIREGELKDLAPLTILVGPNNSGKSTVLDAIMIAASPNPVSGRDFVQQRRSGFIQPLQWLIWRRGMDIRNEAELRIWEGPSLPRILSLHRETLNHGISVSGRYEDPEAITPSVATDRVIFHKGKVTLDHPLKTVPEVRFVDPFGAGQHRPLYELVTQATQNGNLKQVAGLIGSLMPDVKDIRVVVTANGKPDVDLVPDYGSRPEATAGDGVRLLLRLALELATQPGGLKLLEEPETALHPAGVRLAAGALLAAVNQGIQLVVSTHSLDLIDFLLDLGTPEALPKMAVFSLGLEDGELKSTRRSGEEARFARMDIQKDLR